MSDFTPIYAVDFDGTLCESKWPGIGEPNTKLIQYLIRRRSEGVKLILWTCRYGERLGEAVAWCKTHGLEFDAVNENIPEMIECYGADSRKVFASCYIDDLTADKEKFTIPFHAESKINADLIEKYPIGSKWMLKNGKFNFKVEVEKIWDDGSITAKSISAIPALKHYSVRREAEWFSDKLFPLERDK